MIAPVDEDIAVEAAKQVRHRVKLSLQLLQLCPDGIIVATARKPDVKVVTGGRE